MNKDNRVVQEEFKNIKTWNRIHRAYKYIGLGNERFGHYTSTALITFAGIRIAEMIKQHDVLNNWQEALLIGVFSLIYGTISNYLFGKTGIVSPFSKNHFNNS